MSSIFLLVGCGSKERKKVVNIPSNYFVEFSMLEENIYVDNRAISTKIYNQIMQEIEDNLITISKAVNTRIADSTINKINTLPENISLSVDVHTYKMLEICKEVYAISSGKFSPALYNLSEVWGFTPNFEGHYQDTREEPSADTIETAKKNCDFEDLELLANLIIRKKNAALKLDLGGIAKGYMADVVQQIIKSYFPNRQIDCAFQVMSNTVLMGRKRDGSCWRGYNISVENPRSSVTEEYKYNTIAMVLANMTDVAISTSADNYRFYSDGTKIYPHILDLETGKPSSRGMISATAIVPINYEYPATYSDIYSTLAFCLPLSSVIQLYKEKNIGGVLLTNDWKYHTIGNYSIQNRLEYANIRNIFEKSTVVNDDFYQKNKLPELEKQYIQITVKSLNLKNNVNFIYHKRQEKNEE